MEETVCEIICGAPTTLAVKEEVKESEVKVRIYSHVTSRATPATGNFVG